MSGEITPKNVQKQSAVIFIGCRQRAECYLFDNLSLSHPFVANAYTVSAEQALITSDSKSEAAAHVSRDREGDESKHDEVILRREIDDEVDDDDVLSDDDDGTEDEEGQYGGQVNNIPTIHF